MSPERFAKVAALCGAVVLAAWCGGRLGVRPALVHTTAAVPVEHRSAAVLTADAERVDAPQPAAMGNATVANIDVTPAAEPETAVTIDATAAQDEPKLIVDAALSHSSSIPAAEPETAVTIDAMAAKDQSKLIAEAALPDSSPLPAAGRSLVQLASADPSDPMPIDVKKAVALIEIPDECLDACIDRYLWALYERTRKEDSLKVQERRKVTVRRKGKR